MIKKDGYVLWPAYFDARYSVSEGRRVPSSAAVQRPTAEMLAEACRRLGFQAERFDGAHPRTGFLKTGYVVVKAGGDVGKQVLLKLVARELLKIGKKQG